MNRKKLFTTLVLTALVAILVVGAVYAADDGPFFHRNVSGTPTTMTGASAMSSFWLYVPAQTPDRLAAEGILDDGDGIDYLAGDCTASSTDGCVDVYSREEVKPLIVTYNDGIVEEIEQDGVVIDTGAGFGERDGFAALSLDDGATWKRWNLSDSAARSSFIPTADGINQFEPYPGDVFKMVHAVEGNMVVAAWISRYCESGAPLYSWLDEEKAGLLAAYPELDHPVTVDGVTDPYQLYTDDMFTVAGDQFSVDYTAQGFPEVGEVPYGCVWVARGTLEQALDDSGTPLTIDTGDPAYTITWRASERLTSGRRDPHQINITSSPGAGFIIEWQEDPDGLRPGKGLGPGEGWSGAIANAKTDLWYTYIDLAYFSDVCLDDVDDVYCSPGTLADFTTSELFGTKPKAAVPFAMPVRLTDNNMCKYVQKFDPTLGLIDPYCYADFDGNGTADLCAEEYKWVNSAEVEIPVCVAEDNRLMNGRTANTRVRWAMKSYDSDADGVPDSAWVAMGSEKMKALGTVGDLGCDPTTDETCTVYDIGKNMHYYTFEFDKPALGTQGMVLNAPALDPSTGLPFDEVYEDERGFEVVDTEIARRVNIMVNSPTAAMASDSQTMGILIYKQGILFQGGPADVFTRRIVLPEDFEPATMNPFAYENVECVSYDDAGVATAEELLYSDGLNPNYVLGLCPVDGMNVTATNLVRCDDGTSDVACAEQFPFSSTYEEWFSEDSQIQIPKVLEWSQTVDNLNDPSWANPYDVSKGHRGFIDGDFVMMMYATAANWKANTTGNEAYQLYIRRSFDGGQTWTTLPADYTHWDDTTLGDLGVTADGSTSCEWYGGYGEDDYSVCTTYGAGEFEQAHNVSQLAGTRVTVLDPRYSPSGGMLKKDYTKLLCDPELDGIWENCGLTEATYPEDIRNPSVFFATFETGDNSVVTVDTGTIPMDMYYSKASNFGDEWDEEDICSFADTEDSWYPNANVVCDEGDVELRWDWLENGDDLATEASVYGNPSGDRFYAVWNQELPTGELDEHHEEIFTNMDSEYRRIFFNLTTDTVPTAAITYVSSYLVSLDPNDPASTLVLIGDAWDTDRIDGTPYEDIETLEWSLDGEVIATGDRTMSKLVVKSCNADEETTESNCDFNGMHPGWHEFSFKASDKGGKWSPGAEVTIYIADVLHRVYLPLSR